MKTLILLEELAMMALACFGLYYFGAPWWCYLLLVFGPDISMLGYLLNNTVGAISYNLFHHKAVAIAVFITGFLLHQEAVMIVALILFGHSSMDRLFGYGLKLNEGFKYTHLGIIGKK